MDLAFSHSNDEVVIGIVDSGGNLFVYKVVEQPNGTASERLVEVMRAGEREAEDTIHRLVWCPYVPEPDSEVDTRAGLRMLVLTHGATAEVWSLDTVLEEHGSGPLTPADVEHGLITIREIGGEVTDVAFSPTGEAVAIAVDDGTVKFFQVEQSYINTYMLTFTIFPTSGLHARGRSSKVFEKLVSPQGVSAVVPAVAG